MNFQILVIRYERKVLMVKNGISKLEKNQRRAIKIDEFQVSCTDKNEW